MSHSVMISNKRSANRAYSPGKLIILMIVVINICLLILCLANPLKFISFGPPVSTHMKKFTLEDKIEFIYPENWVAQLTPQGNHGDREVIAIVSAPGKFFLNVLIARKKFSQNDISVVAEWGDLRAQSRFVKYRLNSHTAYSSDTVSGSISSYIAKTGSPLETQDVLCKDLYFLHEQIGYAFSFCASESDWTEVSSVFDKMMASIRFVE